MVDTIRLKFNISHLNEEKLLSISYAKSGEIRYKVFKDVIQVGSFSYDLSLYVSNNSQLFLEFSVPKFLYGHNLKEAFFHDLIPVLSSIKSQIDLFCCSPDIALWEVQRLDLCKYIFSDNCYSDIHLYQILDYPRKKKYIYDTSVMFVGSSFSSKFYIKEDEFFKHDFKKISKFDISLAYKLLNISKEKIRFETSYRSKSLKDILHLKKVTLYDIIIKEIYIVNHFNKTLKKLKGDISPQDMKQKNLLSELRKKYKPTRALQLYQFYVFYYSDDFNKSVIKNMYSRSQIYRNMKAIQVALY